MAAATVGEHLAAEPVRARVKEALSALGFDVIRSSPLSVTVAATLDRLEAVFGARPRQGPGGRWDWTRVPKLPPALTEDVGDVVLPQAVELHRDSAGKRTAVRHPTLSKPARR